MHLIFPTLVGVRDAVWMARINKDLADLNVQNLFRILIGKP